MAETREQPPSWAPGFRPAQPVASALVLEQDTAITADEPAVDDGPARDATQSIAFINSAQTEENHR